MWLVIHAQISFLILAHPLTVNVIILMKFPSLAAKAVVKMTTFSAASDENFNKMMRFLFQRLCW